MKKVIKQNWGETLIRTDLVKIVGNDSEGKRIVLVQGVNRIEPGKMIPLHLHENEAEDYVAKTEGLIIVVMYRNTENVDFVQTIKEAKTAEVGKSICCPIGYKHAIYNPTNSDGFVEFVKYKNI